jgi:hypothetical protein
MCYLSRRFGGNQSINFRMFFFSLAEEMVKTEHGQSGGRDKTNLIEFLSLGSVGYISLIGIAVGNHV